MLTGANTTNQPIPENRTPALAKPNIGMITKATHGVRVCSRMCRG